MLHLDFDFKPFKSVRVNSYSLLTNGDFPFITVVEGMVVVEFGEKFAAAQAPTTQSFEGSVVNLIRTGQWGK